MKFLILILCVHFALCVPLDVKQIECPMCVRINTTCYNATYLFDLQAEFRNQVVIPKMAIHARKNTLYYSFEPRIDDAEYYKVAFVNLDHAEQNSVLGSKPQIFNFGTFAIDEDKGIIYLGGSDGIFQIDTNNSSVTPYSSRGDVIPSIFFKGNVYFTVHPHGRVIQKKGDLFEPLKGFEDEYVKDFVIDRNDVTYFTGIFGMFARKGGETIRLTDNAFFRGMTVDRYGDVYAWWIDGIYKVSRQSNFKSSTLVKVSDLPSVGAMAFDKDNNMLLTLGRSLFKMTPTSLLEC